MKYIKRHMLSAIMLLLPALTSCTVGHKLPEVPECPGEACYQTAEEVAWPTTTAGASYIVDVGNFRFKLPTNASPHRIYRLYDGDLYMDLGDDRQIVFGLETRTNVYDGQLPEGGTYTVADSAEYIFELTKDNLINIPSGPDRWVAEMAVFLKNDYFRGGPVYKARKDEVTLYYKEDFPRVGSHYACYIWQANREVYMTVSSSGINAAEFKNILGRMSIYAPGFQQ